MRQSCASPALQLGVEKHMNAWCRQVNQHERFRLGGKQSVDVVQRLRLQSHARTTSGASHENRSHMR